MTIALSHPRTFIALVTLPLLCGLAGAAERGLVFKAEGAMPVRRSTVFPADSHFGGDFGILDIDGEGQPCSVEFLKGCTLKNVKIRVHGGSDLVISGAWLNRCQIEVHPKAIVHISGSALHDCEINGLDGPPPAVPTVKLTNCHLIGSRFLRPLNTIGLQLQDCTVKDQRGDLEVKLDPHTDRAAITRDPLLRYTRFESCSLQPAVLLVTSNCSFKGCTAVGSVEDQPSDPGVTAHLALQWQESVPSEVPGLGVNVELHPLPDPSIGGSTYQAVWNNEAPAPPPEHPSFTATEVAFAEFLDKSRPAAPDSKATDLKRRQTHVNGLLVATLEGGKQAGEISKMNLTATPGAGNLGFNQSVGEDMSTALTEVRKFMQLRHGALPEYLSLQIAFEEKYSGKDGPSAAVACGLLIESAFTGVELDSAFAVTGDMNADGSVQPIGGVAAKMRGATRGACKIIAIPSRNESAIADLIVREGPAPLAAINVFGISKFDEALALASTTREGPIQEAVAEMEIIHQALKRDPSALIPILRTPQAAARLQSVLTKAPHCLSAKYLLLFSQGRQPKFLTLAGSIEAADSDAEGLVSAIDSDFGNAANSLRHDELGGSLNRLRNLRPRLDQRVWPYVDGLVLFGDTLRGVILNPVRSASRAQEVQTQASQAAASANSAKKKLLTDPAVREELGL